MTDPTYDMTYGNSGQDVVTRSGKGLPLNASEYDQSWIATVERINDLNVRLNHIGITDSNKTQVNNAASADSATDSGTLDGYDTETIPGNTGNYVIPVTNTDGYLDIRWMRLPLEAAGAYGFRWNPNDDTKMELGSGNGSPVQDNMARCLLKNIDATRDTLVGIAGYLGALDSTKLDDGLDASSYINGGNNHQVMVEIPLCYTGIRVDNRGHFYFWCCDKPLPGLAIDPAFYVGGDGFPRDYRYMGAYQGVLYDNSQAAYINTTGDHTNQDGLGNGIATVNDWLGSVSGFTPLTDETRGEFRSLIENVGGQGVFWQQDYWLARLIQLLYLTDGSIRSAANPFASQDNIPGHTEEASFNYSLVKASGLTNPLGNASGTYNNGTANVANSFRGVENFFGSIWKWVDGIIVNDHLLWAASNPVDFMDKALGASATIPTGYSSIVDQFGNPVKLPESNDYQKNLHAGTLLPASVGGGASVSTYITDYFYQNPGWRVVLLGGALNDGSKAGFAFFGASDDSTRDSANIGSRLAA